MNPMLKNSAMGKFGKFVSSNWRIFIRSIRNSQQNLSLFFFKLNFLDKTAVALGRQFSELLPMLWMKAGAIGTCPQLENDEIPEMLVLPDNHFAVLTDEKVFNLFVDEVNQHEEITMVYLVVDSDMMYREMARLFPKKQTCQLYRDYLDNFRINQTR